MSESSKKMTIDLVELEHRSLRLSRMLLLIGISLVSAFVINSLLPWVNLEVGRWLDKCVIPVLSPIGIDFRTGVFRPAELLAQGASPYDVGNWYPPFVALAALPLTLLTEDAAYLIQFCALTIANLASILLALRIAKSVSASEDNITGRLASSALFVAVGLYTATGYPFMFSLERGNYDIMAMLLSLVMLWFLTERPTSVWLPVIAFSMAGHLKIYPLLFGLLLIARHRWRCLLPLIVVNTVLLFCLGYSNTIRFFGQISEGLKGHYLWIGNHSAMSFNKMILEPLGFASDYSELLCKLVPVAIFIIGLAFIVKRGFTDRNIVLLFVLSVPVMHLLSGTSHDYKLVILSAPLAIILYLGMHGYSISGKLYYFPFIGSILLLMGFLARSYQITDTLWLQSKYPFILTFQILVLLYIFFIEIPGKKRLEEH